jgi:hypothetical protein
MSGDGSRPSCQPIVLGHRALASPELAGSQPAIVGEIDGGPRLDLAQENERERVTDASIVNDRDVADGKTGSHWVRFQTIAPLPRLTGQNESSWGTRRKPDFGLLRPEPSRPVVVDETVADRVSTRAAALALAQECVVEEAVSCEPVSATNSLLTGKEQGIPLIPGGLENLTASSVPEIKGLQPNSL